MFMHIATGEQNLTRFLVFFRNVKTEVPILNE